ncbi:ArnT family glycosyltransferase [Arenibacter certesii]|nr:glycosyltransferase family 39 protein [Arenibacter certesii]
MKILLTKITTFRFYIVFIAIVFILLINGIGNYGLAETSEARYAEISREMFISSDYLNPKLLGIFHYHKPPLTYYITTVGYRIFGINEFGARFFLQIAIVIQLLLIYGMAQLLFHNKKIAFISGLIYFSIPIVLISSRNLTTDAYLTTFILGAIYCWQNYTNYKRIFYLYLFYILVALGLLTKGPVELIFIFTYIITYKILFRAGFKITLHHALGFILCLLLGGSWYFILIMDNSGLWNYFLEKQLYSRVALDSFNRSKPFWFFIPLIIILLFPWWIPIIGKYVKRLLIAFKGDKESKLLLISTLCTLIVFSIFSTKLILYILPVFWMMSLLISALLIKTGNKISFILNHAFSFMILVFFMGVFTCYIMKPEFIKIANGTLILTFICVSIYTGIYFALDNYSPIKTAILATVFSGTVLVTTTSILPDNSVAINSTKEIIGFINAEGHNQESTILVYDYLLSSVPFYTEANQITLKSTHNTTDREVLFQHDNLWRNNLWDMKDDQTIYRLDSISYKPHTFLLVRKKSPLPNNLNFLKNHFKAQLEYTKWWLYYNK